MNARLLGFALVASLSLPFGSGCTLGNCDPVGSESKAPLELQVSTVVAVRNPAMCDVANPPFSDDDTFFLRVIGETNAPLADDTLTLDVTRTVPLNQAFPLDVSSAATGPTAEIKNPSIQFTFSQGATASGTESSHLDAVVVTVTAMPTTDGEPLGATLQLFFEDGSELDQSFTAPLTSAACTVTTPAPSAG